MKEAHDDFAPDEAVKGLPERLPEGERMLWQGAPSWRRLVWDAYYIKPILAYFGLVAAFRISDGLRLGLDALTIAERVAFLLPFLALAVGLLGAIGWMQARSTVYTITTKRVVMRFGIAYSIAFNLPYSRIEAANLRDRGAGLGDISLQLKAGNRVGYSHFWPHIRPWHLNQPQPMLRAVPDAVKVARILAEAAAAAAPSGVRTRIGLDETAKPVASPGATPQPAG